jgi:hypothetical protein
LIAQNRKNITNDRIIFDLVDILVSPFLLLI